MRAGRRLEPYHPRDQFPLIRMRAEAIQRHHLGAALHRLAEDVDRVLPVPQATPQRALGLESHEQNGVPRLAQTVFKVVQDAPALAHARCRDDDARGLALVERARLIGGHQIAQAVEAERRAILLLERAARLVVEAFRMMPERLRRAPRHRAVHEDRHFAHHVALHQIVQRRDQLLRASDRERRDQHAPAARQRALHHLGQLPHGVLRGRVLAITVGALQDQHVHAARGLGIAQDGAASAADVAAHAEAHVPPVLLELEHGERRAQDVSGIEIRDAHVFEQRPGVVVGMAHHLLERAVDVVCRVERTRARARRGGDAG